MSAETPLHYPAFRHALVAQAISGAGSWMQTVAAGWLVYDLTDSASAVGVLTVLSRGPGVFLSPLGGELADRFQRRRLIAVLSLCQGLAAAVLALVEWWGTSTTLEIYAASLVIGVASALASPALQEVVSTTVPAEQHKKATGLGSLSYNIARLVGPVVGGALVVSAGAGACFGINAASYLALIALVVTLPPAQVASSARARARDAMVEARRDPILWALFLGVILFSVFIAPVQDQAPAIARRHGNGAHLLGFLLAALAAGGLLGNSVRSRLDARSPDTDVVMAVCILIGGVAMLGLSFTANFVVALVTMVACGMAWDVLYVVSLTSVQFRDPKVSGLMIGLYFSAVLGGVTVGALVMGAVFDLIGVDWGLAAIGTLVVLYGLHRTVSAFSRSRAGSHPAPASEPRG